MWLKSQGSTAATVEIPDDLFTLAKSEKANAAIESSDSESD